MLQATLIGDLVRSRATEDRRALDSRLEAAIAEVNAEFEPLTPLRVTVGDEYQGAFATVADAVRASLRMQVLLAPAQPVRHGLGWGEVDVLRTEPRVEDGPGWWAARAAIVEVGSTWQAARLRFTSYVVASDAPGAPDPAWVNATLALRDAVVGQLSERSARILEDLLAGRTQAEIAATLGVSPSAVSQRIRGDGLHAVVSTDELVRGER